jgi:hypothetical protein
LGVILGGSVRITILKSESIMAQLNFKASSVEIPERQGGAYGPLSAGEYEMIITRSATKQTKSGNGSYLELEMQVVSGPSAGRRHWERLNLDNPSAQTVKIAQEQLAKLCMALGLDEVNDSEELHDTPFIAEIGIDKKDDQRNVIWGYAPAMKAKPAAKPAAAPINNKRPWG